MKLKYKHQRFQADAAKSVTDIFTGQQYCDSADYLMDQGKNKGGQSQLASATLRKIFEKRFGWGEKI